METLDTLKNGYKIFQDSDKFKFGIDAILLSYFCFDLIRKGDSVIDLGTGTGILPIIYVITEDGKVYTGSFFEHDFELRLDNRLKEYEVEDILSKTGEMKDNFKLLLKDGTTKTVTVEL